jgi:tetratricopeptide (TPR) repeat protein
MAKHKKHRKPVKGGGAPEGRTKTSISLVMIVRNEEHTLPRCLASVKGIVDEIVVVDTGSTDRTREVATAHGAKLGEFTWCDDFAAARNHALSLATGAWVLHLDADEALSPDSGKLLRGLTAAAPAPIWAYSLPVVSLVDEDGRVEETVSNQKRLFRRQPGLTTYRRAIHEEIMHLGKPVGEGVARVNQPRIIHEGYRGAEVGRKFSTRNLPILLKAHEQDPAEPYYHIALSLFASVTGDIDKAAQYFTSGYQLMSERERRMSEQIPVAACELMHALLEAGRYKEAWHVSEAIADFVAMPEVDLYAGRAYLGMGDIANAVERLNRARAADGPGGQRIVPGATSWLPLWDLTSCALLCLDSAGGLQAAREGLSLMPEPRGLVLRAALFALRVGDLSAASEFARAAALTGVEQSAEASLLETISAGFEAIDDKHGLLAALSDLLDAGDSVTLRRQRAAVYAALQFHGQALEDLERALELAPHDAITLVESGKRRRLLGDTRGAIAAFVAATTADPANGEAWLERGRLQHSEGAVVDATDAARRAVELLPDAGDARRLLAECLRQRGDIPQGCEVLIEGLERRPEDKDTRLLLVSLLDTAGARDESFAVLAQGLDYDSRDAGLYVKLGNKLLDRGNTDDAFNAFEVALSLDPRAGVLEEALKGVQRLSTAPAKTAPGALPAPTAPAMGLRFGRAAMR